MSEGMTCSFCGDGPGQYDGLIRSDLADPPPALICENCVRICVGLVAMKRGEDAAEGIMGKSKRQRDGRDGRDDPPSGLSAGSSR